MHNAYCDIKEDVILEEENELQLIQSIKNDRPVILKVAGVIDQIQYLIDEIHDFGFDTGIGMYIPNDKKDDISSDLANSMCWHYVTVTGVYLNDYTGKVYLKVQSWGKVYF